MDEFTQQNRDVSVVELLDRLVDRGVVLSGDIKISVADIDLIEIGLRLLIRTPILPHTQLPQVDSAREQEGSDDIALRVRPVAGRE